MADSFKSLEEILKSEPSLQKIHRKLSDSGVVHAVPDIFPELRQFVTPVKVEKMVLFLRVENPVLRSEIKLNEAAFIKKINDFFNEIRIAALRFV